MTGSLLLLRLGSVWTARWHPVAVEQSGIFCYRNTIQNLLGDETA